MERFIVIAEGKEICYANPFIELFRMQNDKVTYTSSKGKIINPELYSKQVYLHSSIPKNAFILVIGNATVATTIMKLVYDEYGMNCYLGERFAKIIVDESKFSANYDSIFIELEKIEKEYFAIEKEYVRKTGMKKSEYVITENKIFQKKWVNDRKVQAYLYLAYYFYIHELDRLLKEI